MAAVEGGLRFLVGGPREADLSSPPREVGLASDPREGGRATLGAGRGLPSVLRSSSVALVTAVGSTADPSFSHGSELLTFIGVVGVEVVVHSVPAALG